MKESCPVIVESTKIPENSVSKKVCRQRMRLPF